MSSAYKCDKCDQFYTPEHGAVHLDLHMVASPDTTDSYPETFDSWTDIDLCPSCSSAVLDAIGGACNGINRPQTVGGEL